MDIDNYYFAFSEDTVEKLIKLEIKKKMKRANIILYPTFDVDRIQFNYAQYDRRTPGLFKVETTSLSHELAKLSRLG